MKPSYQTIKETDLNIEIGPVKVNSSGLAVYFIVAGLVIVAIVYLKVYGRKHFHRIRDRLRRK